MGENHNPLTSTDWKFMNKKHNKENSVGRSSNKISTYFAPAERASETELNQWLKVHAETPLFKALEQSIDGYLMILNPQRQVLTVNKQLLDYLRIPDVECLVGMRPGEALNCVHSRVGPGGCGTAPACSTCGAVISILNSQEKQTPVVNECLATVRHGDHIESLEFRVRATPVSIGQHVFTVMIFQDISGDKRKEILEKIFFHDILNMIGGLVGWSQLLQNISTLDPKEVAGRITHLSNRLSREVHDQQRLTQAEKGNLEIDIETVTVQKIFDTLISIFETHEVTRGRKIDFPDVESKDTIITDSSLLVRILTNMIKNALEASERGGIIRVWFEHRNGAPTFFVHNATVIPENVALRIFQRSFSTKAPSGRGIGTYIMKLFGERYLGGIVDFISNEENGTLFWIQLPVAEPPQKQNK